MDSTIRKQLEITAAKVRMGIIEGTFNAKSGHPGGSLSIADLLTYLYTVKMNVNPADPDMKERDRLVLSKGHTAPALYSVLAEKGFFPKEELKSLRHIGALLQGHPCIHIPGVDMSSGSLGQGISVACGIALAGKSKIACDKFSNVVPFPFKTVFKLSMKDCCNNCSVPMFIALIPFSSILASGFSLLYFT